MTSLSLVGVRTELNLCNTEHATTFTALIDSGNLAPYKSKEILKRRLGLEGGEYPTVGKKQAPTDFRAIASLKNLQDICLRELLEARNYFANRLTYFTHSGSADDSTETGDENDGMQTIKDLTNNNNAEATKTAVTFPSETLENMCSEDQELPEHLVRAAMTTCSVLPYNTLLPLHHSNEGTTVVTVLSGSIVWIIWPSTSHNLRTLQTAYERFAESFDETMLDVANELEGGLTFAQGEGDGLRIPPLCPMMCLATKTTVLATCSHITVDEFIAMLQKASLLKAWFRTEIDGDRKRADFNAALLRHLDLMLNGDPDDEDGDEDKLSFTKGGPLETLLKTWDDVKDDLAAMVGPADSAAMENIWEAFLITAKGRECRLCGKRISNKQRLMKAHFVSHHWAKAKEVMRVDSMGAHDGDMGDTVAKSTELEIDGAMEVDR